MKYFKTEDWLSLAAGLLIIALAASGLYLPALKLKWGAFDVSTATIVLQYFFAVTAASLGLMWLYSPSAVKHFGIVLPVFLLAVTSIYISSIAGLKRLGLEYVIFSLLIGLALRNVVKLPVYFTANSYSEYFVKAGLVLLGSSVIFGDILKAGSLGLIQALVVVVAVWYFAFWLSNKLKIDEELKMMISSAVSICGVSAAIATAGAIKGDSKKLSYVVSLVLIVAIPMLIFQPLLATAIGLSPQVAGAWLGGTIDTTGAVVASGELLGEEALKYSTVVKFSQNILLGIAALLISIYWSLRPQQGGTKNIKIEWAVIWERFPKFVPGFIGASLLFSFVLPAETVVATKDYLKAFQTLLFSMAFVFIGIETDFKSLIGTGQGKPALVFLGAQAFNILFTLAVSYLLFH